MNVEKTKYLKAIIFKSIKQYKMKLIIGASFVSGYLIHSSVNENESSPRKIIPGFYYYVEYKNFTENNVELVLKEKDNYCLIEKNEYKTRKLHNGQLISISHNSKYFGNFLNTKSPPTFVSIEHSRSFKKCESKRIIYGSP